MSRSTPIQQLPVDTIDEIKDEDESINQVLDEIEKQNMGNVTENFRQPPLNNNISPTIMEQPQQQRFMQQPNFNQAQFNQQQFAMNNANMQQQNIPINTTLTQAEINQFLKDNNVGNNSWSLFNLWNILQSEFKLAIAIFIIVLLLQNHKFNTLIENNLGFINVPYFDTLMKALVCSVLVIVIKKFIS